VTNEPLLDSFKSKIAAAKAVHQQLQSNFLDAEARRYFLQLGEWWLDDAENHLLPHASQAATERDAAGWLRALDMTLKSVEKIHEVAKDAIQRYGPSVRIIG
jgi:hypothetical protein